MGSLTLPSQNGWGGLQPGRGGILHRTFNVDFETVKGEVLLSRRFLKLADTSSPDTSMANLTTPQQFLRTDADDTDGWWALATDANSDTTTAGNLFKNSTKTISTIGWHQDTLANTPVDAKDMVTWETNDSDDRLVVSRWEDIAVLNDTATNAWTSSWWQTKRGQPALKSGVPHPLLNFDRLLVIGDGNLVHTVDKDEVVNNTRLTLRTDLISLYLFRTPLYTWNCCYSLRSDGNGGGTSAVAQWDGASPGATIYDLPGDRVLSGVSWNGIPYVINDQGIIFRFNGYAFVYDAEFPCLAEGLRLYSAQTGAYAIAPRGMTVENDLIYINVGSVELGLLGLDSRRMTAGIWVYNPRTRDLYPKHSIGGTNDFGQQKIRQPGAVVATADPTTKLLIGARYYKTYASIGQTHAPAIFCLQSFTSAVNNRGFLETQPIRSSVIRNQWHGIWAKYRRLDNSNAKIIIKSRALPALRDIGNNADFPITRSITWKSTTTFEVAFDTATVGGNNCPAIGDEVEIVTGDNAGYLAHITAIGDTTGAALTNICGDTTTRLITIDETVTSSSNTALARFDRWKKLDTAGDTTMTAHYFPDGDQSDMIQYKVEMRGPFRTIELNELIPYFSEQTPIEK